MKSRSLVELFNMCWFMLLIQNSLCNIGCPNNSFENPKKPRCHQLFICLAISNLAYSKTKEYIILMIYLFLHKYNLSLIYRGCVAYSHISVRQPNNNPLIAILCLCNVAGICFFCPIRSHSIPFRHLVAYAMHHKS